MQVPVHVHNLLVARTSIGYLAHNVRGFSKRLLIAWKNKKLFKNGCFFLQKSSNFSKNDCFFLSFFGRSRCVMWFPTKKNIYLQKSRFFSKNGCSFLEKIRNFETIVAYFSQNLETFRSKNACFLSEPFLMSEAPLYMYKICSVFG